MRRPRPSHGPGAQTKGQRGRCGACMELACMELCSGFWFSLCDSAREGEHILVCLKEGEGGDRSLSYCFLPLRHGVLTFTSGQDSDAPHVW